MKEGSFLLPRQRYLLESDKQCVGLAIERFTGDMPGTRKERRVGIEMEMSGIELAAIAKAVQSVCGGDIRVRSKYEMSIVDTELGTFSIELDSDMLKRAGRELQDNPNFNEDFEQWATDAMAALAQNIVPCELAGSPIAISQLYQLDAIVTALREVGAKGTRQTPWYAFGVHYNIELPSLEADTITAYLKAFLCLNDWLIWHEQVDLTRRIPPYINVFPTDYVQLVVDPDYWPELAELITDYLEYNATRNRILDLLPLFDLLDHSVVESAVSDHLIKARPALHYRLPNCEIDLPNWSLSQAWNDWWQVEMLASDSQRLEKWCYRYWIYLQQPMRWPFVVPWKEQVPSCLIEPS